MFKYWREFRIAGGLITFEQKLWLGQCFTQTPWKDTRWKMWISKRSQKYINRCIRRLWITGSWRLLMLKGCFWFESLQRSNISSFTSLLSTACQDVGSNCCDFYVPLQRSLQHTTSGHVAESIPLPLHADPPKCFHGFSLSALIKPVLFTPFRDASPVGILTTVHWAELNREQHAGFLLMKVKWPLLPQR